MDTWLTLNDAIGGFLLECQARHLSPHTIEDYNRTLQQLAQYIGNLPVKLIKTSHITQFLAGFAHLKPKSLLNKYVGLSALWTWLVRENYLDQHIVRQIPKPRIQPCVIEPLSEMEVRALFSALGRKLDRNKIILLVLLDTGVRASELINMKWADIDLPNRRIRVLGKGNKERFVPIGTRTASALFRYHTQYKEEKPFDMTRTRLAHMVGEIGDRAKIPGVHPHRFRHTFAINYLRNGGDIFTLQMILGHSTLEMVKRYLALAQVDVDIAHSHASPVNHWKL